MFAIPFLLWAGNNLMECQIMVVVAMMPQNILGWYKLRHAIEIKDVAKPALLRIATLPLGLAGLVYVLTWSPAQINQLVGILILSAVVAQSFIGIEWKNASRWYWQVITFGGSGFLQGLSGMSGPPLVLWVHGQRFRADKARAFLFAMYTSNLPPQLALLWWRFGAQIVPPILIALASLPTVMLGAMLGLRLGSRLGDRMLRPISYGILLLLAAYSIIAPFLLS